MPFPFNAYLPAFLGSFFATLMTLPLWRAWCLRVGLVDDPGHRKIHHAPLPLAAGVRITLFVHSALFSYLITVLWILTVTNAFNFMDNMNGLCAGLGAIASLCFGLIAAAAGQYLVALIALAAAGALLGFIPYNYPKATAFLGDAGSHLVGYLLAVIAILPHFYSRRNQDVLAVFKPLLILAVPLLDLVWVVLLRWKSGKPFYLGDT